MQNAWQIYKHFYWYDFPRINVEIFCNEYGLAFWSEVTSGITLHISPSRDSELTRNNISQRSSWYMQINTLTMCVTNICGLPDSSSIISSLVSYVSPPLSGQCFVHLYVHHTMYKANAWFVEWVNNTFSQALMVWSRYMPIWSRSGAGEIEVGICGCACLHQSSH